MSITARYEPKEGDNIGDMLLHFEVKRLAMIRLLEIVKRIAKSSCCIDRDDCISCDAVRLLKELGEDE